MLILNKSLRNHKNILQIDAEFHHKFLEIQEEIYIYNILDRQAILIITSGYRHTSHEEILKETGICLLATRRYTAILTLMYKLKKILLMNT